MDHASDIDIFYTIEPGGTIDLPNDLPNRVQDLHPGEQQYAHPTQRLFGSSGAALRIIIGNVLRPGNGPPFWQ
jgi:hypothetical protein